MTEALPRWAALPPKDEGEDEDPWGHGTSAQASQPSAPPSKPEDLRHTVLYI